MRNATAIGLGIIIVSFVIAISIYPQMPDPMPSHWNTQGQVDGYMPKFLGMFLMPLISVGLLLLFIVIPRIDPLKHNIEKFRGYFDGFVVLILLFLLYIYMLTLFWSANITFGMTQAIIPAIAILFFYIGILVSKAKRNWFIGIRTPWTLSSDKVWNKTHSRGGKLFMAAGVIAMFGLLFGDYAIWLILVPVLASALYLVVYSYFEYQKVGRHQKKSKLSG